MEKSGLFIINEWLRLIELYMVEYSKKSRESQSEENKMSDEEMVIF